MTRNRSTRLTVLFLAVVVPPAVTLVWLPTTGERIASGNSEVWALENVLPALKAGR